MRLCVWAMGIDSHKFCDAFSPPTGSWHLPAGLPRIYQRAGGRAHRDLVYGYELIPAPFSTRVSTNTGRGRLSF